MAVLLVALFSAAPAPMPPLVLYLASEARLPETLVNWEPSTAGSLALPSSLTTFPAAVPVLRMAAVPRPMAVDRPDRLVWPVPPLATGRVPVTAVVRSTWPQAGAVPVPLASSTLPVAAAFSLERVVAPEA